MPILDCILLPHSSNGTMKYDKEKFITVANNKTINAFVVKLAEDIMKARISLSLISCVQVRHCFRLNCSFTNEKWGARKANRTFVCTNLKIYLRRHFRIPANKMFLTTMLGF